ncbi:MAG: hypothetical protein ABI811_24140 [Acidobacteriota bacterium]
MTPSGSNKKVSNSLVGLSFAAVLAVYSAGYARTRSAADQLEARSAERRPANPTAPQRSAPATGQSIAPEPGAAAVDATSSTGAREAPAAADRAGEKPGLIASAELIAPAANSPSPAIPETPVVSAPSAVAQPVQPTVPVAAVPVAAAPVPVAEPKPVVAAAPAPKWRDGTYTGWGTSRHGNIEAAVTIQNGKIAASRISQCLTRYSCDVIDFIIPQPVVRQSPDVDYVSRATQSADAYYYAVVEALGKAEIKSDAKVAEPK